MHTWSPKQLEPTLTAIGFLRVHSRDVLLVFTFQTFTVQNTIVLFCGFVVCVCVLLSCYVTTKQYFIEVPSGQVKRSVSVPFRSSVFSIRYPFNHYFHPKGRQHVPVTPSVTLGKNVLEQTPWRNLRSQEPENTRNTFLINCAFASGRDGQGCVNQALAPRSGNELPPFH